MRIPPPRHPGHERADMDLFAMRIWRKYRAAILALLLWAPVVGWALTAEEQQQFADGLFSRGLYEMAHREYQRAIQEFPDYTARDLLLFRAAECQRKMGHPAKATEYFREIIVLNKPGTYLDRARLRLTEQHIQAGQIKEAIELLNSILAAKPTQETEAAALYYMGLARVRNGEKEIGRRGFASILVNHPHSSFAPYAALELARLLNEGGAPFGEVKAMTDKVLASSPPKNIAVEAQLLLADAANRRDDFVGAADAYLALLKTDPRDARLQEDALKAAWACLRAERFEGILQVLPIVPAAIRQSHPADMLYLEANALRKTGRMEEAMSRYAALVKDHAESEYAPFAAYELALTAYRSRKFAEVVALAGLLGKHKDLAADGKWLVADSLRESGRVDDAIDAFAKWAVEYPKDPRASEALFHAAQMSQQQKKFLQASTFYSQQAAAYPESSLAPRALYGSALALLAENRLPEAVESWVKLADQYPEHELTRESLLQAGLALVRMEKQADAIKLFTRLTSAPREDVVEMQAAYWSGILLEQQLKFAEAEKFFRRVMELGKDDALTARAGLRLAYTLQKLEKPAEASQILRGLLDKPVVSEMDPALLEWLARYSFQESHWDDVVRAADLLTLKEGTDPQWRLIGYHLKGMALRKLSRNEEALKAFQSARTISLNTRERADAAIQAGELCLLANKPVEATTAFEDGSQRASALSLTDLQAQGYLGMGKAVAATGDHDAASRYFLTVAVLFDDPMITPEALHLAADSFRKLGRATEADKAQAELKTRYPDYAP